MLEDDAHKEILLEDYKRHRAQADKLRERDQYDSAAAQYEKAASLLERIAELESTDQLAAERRKLAQNLHEAVEKLRAAETPDTDAGTPATGSPGEPETDSARSSDAESGEIDAEKYLSDPPELDFGDVGGMSELKQTLIDKVIDPLERRDLYEQYDLGVVNAVLLHGPPGTGKTYITKALAGKLDYNYIEASPADITSSLVGESSKNMQELFAVARANQPCLLFIDEIEAIVPDRSGGSQKTQSERQMVNQYLQEVSDTKGEDVVLIAATNLPEEIDDAANSRFQERIEVPPPDAVAREAVLKVHLRDRPVLTDSIDWDRIRERTDGYSSRDLENIATEAARKALSDAKDAGGIEHITQAHLESAIENTDKTLADWGRT